MAASTVAEQTLWTSSTQVASFLRLVTEHEDAEAKRIGQLIAELRLKEGWSQQDLANELDMSVSTVSRWERGIHEGYAENVRKLAKALKVHPSLLRPTHPDVETQLDRMEEKLDRLLALSGEEAVSGEGDDQAPAVVADASARLVEAAGSPPRKAPARPKSEPAAKRRKRA